MEQSEKNRRHSAEFRIEIAQRMLAGESVMALSRRFGLARSMMYRWRAAYREKGVPGLSRPVGRSPGASAVAQAPSAQRGAKVEEQLRRKVAELERKVGQQAVEIDFFKEVFKRLDELPKAPRRGGDASTAKSGG
jgi:transposase